MSGTDNLGEIHITDPIAQIFQVSSCELHLHYELVNAPENTHEV